MDAWKIIDNYNNYWISNKGQVFNKSRNYTLIGEIQKSGYRYVNLSKDHNHKAFRVNRLVANAFVPNPLNKPIVNHIDGNKLNNDFTNLEWVSHSENTNHSYSNKLQIGKSYNKIKVIDNTGIIHESKHHAARFYNMELSSIYKSIKRGTSLKNGISFKEIR